MTLYVKKKIEMMFSIAQLQARNLFDETSNLSVSLYCRLTILSRLLLLSQRYFVYALIKLPLGGSSVLPRRVVADISFISLPPLASQNVG